MNSRQRHSFSFFLLFSILFLTASAIPPAVAAPHSPQTPAATASGLQSRAESGDAAAQYLLAKSILGNQPSPEDIQSALKWLRASVSQNNSNAALYLGYLYEHGQFVSQDYGLAFENYQIAAREHFAPAENNLATLYQRGQGVAKNEGKAIELYIASAEHGDPVGQLNLASLYYAGRDIPRNYDEAIRWLRLASDAHLPEAQNCLAYFYFKGIGVQRDYSEAARLVRLAAAKGLPSAETNLGFLYEQGKGVPLDYIAAYAWYSRGIAAGDSNGSENRKVLGRIMTRKQLDEANSLVTASASPVPAPRRLLQPAIPSPDGFSLLNAQH